MTEINVDEKRADRHVAHLREIAGALDALGIAASASKDIRNAALFFEELVETALGIESDLVRLESEVMTLKNKHDVDA